MARDFKLKASEVEEPLSFEMFTRPYSFVERPSPVLADFRPEWRIAALLIIVSESRSQKASLKKLHVINWGLRNADSREQLIEALKGTEPASSVVIRFEPALNQAIQIGKEEGLWGFIQGKSIQLTAKGITAAQALNAMMDCMVDEKSFVSELKSFMTENRIDAILNWENI